MPTSTEHFFRTLTENSADILCRVGPDQRMRYTSPSCTRVLGWLPEEMVGKAAEDLVVPEDLEIVLAATRESFAHPEDPCVPATVRVRHKDGSAVWMEITASIINPGEPGAEVVLVMRDVSERKAFEEQLTQLALTDGLTTLLNRRGFDELLEDTWQKTLQAGSQLSLLLLDVDHFKAFNDRYGHLAGDDCLRTIAEAIRSCLLRSADQAARYGGEELAVILPGTSAEGAGKIAEEIRHAIEGLCIPHDGNLRYGRVTVSIGIATAVARCGGSMRMPESLLLAADNALYRAKHDGRNRVRSMMLLASKAS